MPSRTISGRPPTRRATTGVPQASDSIATSPNGSGQSPGHERREALGEQPVAVGRADLADELDVGRPGRRPEDVLEVVAFRAGPSAPWRRPGGVVPSDGRSRSPRRRPSRVPSGRRSTDRRRGARRTARLETQPVGDDRPSDVGLGRGLGLADRTQPGRRVDQEAVRPRLVEPAVERRDDRRRTQPGRGRSRRSRDARG